MHIIITELQNIAIACNNRLTFLRQVGASCACQSLRIATSWISSIAGYWLAIAS